MFVARTLRLILSWLYSSQLTLGGGGGDIGQSGGGGGSDLEHSGGGGGVSSYPRTLGGGGVQTTGAAELERIKSAKGED